MGAIEEEIQRNIRLVKMREAAYREALWEADWAIRHDESLKEKVEAAMDEMTIGELVDALPKQFSAQLQRLMEDAAEDVAIDRDALARILF